MKRQNKLGTYLAVTAGVGCVTSASAATVVTFFDDENMSGLGEIIRTGDTDSPNLDVLFAGSYSVRIDLRGRVFVNGDTESFSN